MKGDGAAAAAETRRPEERMAERAKRGSGVENGRRVEGEGEQEVSEEEEVGRAMAMG